MIKPSLVCIGDPVIRLVVSDCDSSGWEIGLIIVFLIILIGGVADEDGAIHSKGSLSEGAESMLMSPHPAGEFGQDLKELAG